MSKVSIIGHIAPWALPNEKIPMHVTWSSDVLFDKIRVHIPPDFKITDVLNVDEVNITENTATITKVKPPVEGVPSYFGMVMSPSEVYEELKVAKKILVEFLRGEETITCLELYARIFRPRLEVLKAPAVIELTNDIKTQSLPLNLRYTGFGDIELRMEGIIGGGIVSVGESLVYELLRRLWLSDILEKKTEKGVEISEKERERRMKELWIEPTYIRKMAEELQKKIEAGAIPFEELDEKAIEELRKWLTDTKTKDKYIEILYERTENLLLSLLVDLFEKNPADNVRLSAAHTTIKTKIKAPVEKLTLKLEYRDTLRNEYLPIKIPIKIQDNRKEQKGTQIEMPIIIEKWESKPFMDVEKMKIAQGKSP